MFSPRAIILPVGSSKILKGTSIIPNCLITLLSQYLKSHALFHIKLSSFIARSHFDLDVFFSKAILSIVKLSVLYFLNKVTRPGWFSRQGLHQVPQKSTNKYFPLKVAKESGFPKVSGSVKLTANLPTMEFEIESKTLFNEIADGRCRTSLDNTE